MALTRSNKSFPSTACYLSSSAVHLSYPTRSENLMSCGSSVVKSIVIGIWMGWVGSRCCLFGVFAPAFWGAIRIWDAGGASSGWVDVPSPSLALNICSSKLVRCATSFRTPSSSLWYWASSCGFQKGDLCFSVYRCVHRCMRKCMIVKRMFCILGMDAAFSWTNNNHHLINIGSLVTFFTTSIAFQVVCLNHIHQETDFA